MTKQQRAQVVELLRRAHADRTSISGAADAIDRDRPEVEPVPISSVVAAIRASNTTWGEEPAGAYWDVCLRAAARVELEEWP